MVKERGIIFDGDMVRAILEGRKTQTRRIIKPQPRIPLVRTYGGSWRHTYVMEFLTQKDSSLKWNCPYGAIGQRLWVRETFARLIDDSKPIREVKKYYKATENKPDYLKWRKGILMPRWASRITLEITNIRVERVQGISNDGAKLEGVNAKESVGCCYHVVCNCLVPSEHRRQFSILWNSIYGSDAWDKNCWVWAIEFKVV